MNRRLKFFVLIVMLAIVPIRALATLTTGFCAMEATSSPGHAGHHGDDQHDGCDSCVEHCASGAIVALPGLLLPPASGAARFFANESFTGGFIPEHLDPPPLAA